MEDCGGDACGLRVNNPHGVDAGVVNRGAYDKSFDAVFGECALTLWLVNNKGFRADRNKGSGIVVVWAIHVGVDGNFGACFRLA